MTEEQYMQLAMELAERGVGAVNPNPLVGAVIVKDDVIVGQGYHEKYGGLHAERNALASCETDPKGATMYVTLEPCCHHGKTPPCTDAIIESGIAKVVVGQLDPNPLVAGKGVEILRKSGVEVVTGVLERECREQNRCFCHYMETRLPYVLLKYAMTMDGKIATAAGHSKWITGEEARKKVHRDRHRFSSIMVGVGTVIADNPQLTCRIEGGRNPIRVICDTNLRTPLDSVIVKTARETRTLIATCCDEAKKRAPFLAAGCELIDVPRKENGVDLRALMESLGKMGIDSILLEGGSTLNFSALEAGIVQQVQAYIAPKIFGGATAKTPVGGAGFARIPDSVKLKNSVVSRWGDDILIESEVSHSCSQEL